MLLYVTGPAEADEAVALAFYHETAAALAPLARSLKHPRSGAPLDPVITRLDLFLQAFAPAPAPAACGLRVAIPPPEHAYMWGIPLRGPLRHLIQGAFSPSQRYFAPFDPVGPRTAQPARDELPPMSDIVAEVAKGVDPAQLPSDPRLWLVLAPPMAAAVELMFLPSFLRAEPYARVARGPSGSGWLAREVDLLLSGKELATHGLVFSTNGGPQIAVHYKDPSGQPVADIVMLEATTALEESYAWKAVLQPGQCYARLHAHTGSEELYVVLEGEGTLRVNERTLPIKAGDCFGKPRNYDTATQIVNTGSVPLVMIDFGTMQRDEVDLCRYPEHGELLARFAGHRWMLPGDALRPGAEFFPLYDRRYYRTSKS